MGKEGLHIFFLPWLAPSHIMSLLDMATLFAHRGVRVSVVTTHGNAFRCRAAIEKANSLGLSMHLLLIPFPSAQVGLPQGCEATSSMAPTPSNVSKFYQALTFLEHPFHQLVHDHRPHCIISDECYIWTSCLGIPRIIFVPYSPFYVCVYKSLAKAAANCMMDSLREDGGDSMVVSVDGLPHRIELMRSEIPIWLKSPEYLQLCREAERKSFGMVATSFYELTPDYVDHCCQEQLKLWCVGPLWLCNKSDAERGGISSGGEICSWLDLQPHGSVVYVCFGTEYTAIGHEQYKEIAFGLESMGHPFVWVVKDDDDSRIAEWMSTDLEDRLRGRGVIWKGWAPQLQILNHPAVGGFVTHCGWNSILEAVSAGITMVAWPMQWEQFINERLIVDVLGIGIRLLEGAAQTVATEKEIQIKGEVLSCAVKRLMGGGEEASTMRLKAIKLKEMARSSMEEGGSSHTNLSRLIEELTALVM